MSLISLLFFVGLKSPMCGTNSSLTKDVTFRTQSFYITVLFQSDATGLNFLSKFNMTFLSFSEGKLYCTAYSVGSSVIEVTLDQ